jgi:hypothetical protein
MGRSFAFECPRCSYRAKVAGGADRGFAFHVQTITCDGCHELYDAVTRLKVPIESTLDSWKNVPTAGQRKKPAVPQPPARPPLFQAALNRLRPTGVQRFRWASFKLQCPVSPFHAVRPWGERDKCPKCGWHVEKQALPFRIWD